MRKILYFLISSLFVFSCQLQKVDSCKELQITSNKLIHIISSNDTVAFYNTFLPPKIRNNTDTNWLESLIGRNVIATDSAFLKFKNHPINDFSINMLCGTPNASWQESIWDQYIKTKKKIKKKGIHSIRRIGFETPINDTQEIINVGYLFISSNLDNQKYQLSFFLYQYYNDNKWYISEMNTYKKELHF